jgi:hypothetical protein
MAIAWEKATAAKTLFELGVFDFGEAERAIESVLGRPEDEGARSAHDVLQLTASEFALLPAFLSPLWFSLPMRSRITVSGFAGMAAVVKGSCSLTRPLHYGLRNLATFSGDADKLAAIRDRSEGDPSLDSWNSEASWPAIIKTLEEDHASSGGPLAEAVAASGLLRVQGLVWAAKHTLLLELPSARERLANVAFELGVGG